MCFEYALIIFILVERNGELPEYLQALRVASMVSDHFWSFGAATISRDEGANAYPFNSRPATFFILASHCRLALFPS
uniref:Uncharacterized protein n=1 Tax=Physcomitrium patens TaxID=3218 RepID=A0A2K1JXM3_PHYPA|nr:hypothetical protein PHYPA_013395 [Physcomitrium patens]